MKKTKHALVEQICSFLNKIGIPTKETIIEHATFLPGIHVEQGKIHYDRTKLVYPGDLLHEAGHLALLFPAERKNASGNIDPEGATNLNSLEPGVILWSYAALVHLRLDPKIVFHESGYRGSSQWYIENFTDGNYIGLPLLQWMGLAKSNEDQNDTALPFPCMLKWLRE
jgi:hypothetical protein